MQFNRKRERKKKRKITTTWRILCGLGDRGSAGRGLVGLRGAYQKSRRRHLWISIEDETVLGEEEVFEVFTVADLNLDGALDVCECVHGIDMFQKLEESM